MVDNPDPLFGHFKSTGFLDSKWRKVAEKWKVGYIFGSERGIFGDMVAITITINCKKTGKIMGHIVENLLCQWFVIFKSTLHPMKNA